MSWRPPTHRWNMRVPTRFAGIKILVMVFFTILVLAPVTAWLFSLPMWAMDVLGFLLGSGQREPGARWFGAGMVAAGVPCLAVVGWRAWRERDLDAGVMAGVAAVIWLVTVVTQLR
ncbi:hypothetical protein J5226_21900 [Lysobacter sp. K5869]|uniref:hypothetical protein n=1 Tax=Lysobacter sp. K5869 TaxID=2820808 RepID=UPI001C062344|nr:hypothetical protein [Lysobacter sp. K5869]QWP76211.1 hypothetical protein J5226_21900 [Lysobacter sp. K5869]